MKLRRVGALAIAAALAGAFGSAGSASADTAEAYVGSAAGRALNLDIPALGAPLTMGASKASLNSTLDAVAEGTGFLTPLGSNVAASEIKDGSVVKAPVGETCATPPLPAEVASMVNLGVGCAASSAVIENGFMTAASTGTVAGLDLQADTLLSQVPIGGILDQVFTPLIGNVAELDPALTTVKDLVSSVLETKTLEVELGASTSKVTTNGTSVISEATAAGGEIRILPTPELSAAPELSNVPVATITIGSSAAKAVYDRASGVSAEPTFDAAIVTVKLSPALGLPAAASTITVKPGQTQTILAGTPLESTITVANGAIVTNADGTKGAVADGVKLELLKGVSGGVILELAHSEAGVAGTPATKVLSGCVGAGCETLRELPRTGGFPVLPVLGSLLLAAALIVRRTVASAR